MFIASSSSKSSSTKGDILEGGGVSSNVTLSDSLKFLLVCDCCHACIKYCGDKRLLVMIMVLLFNGSVVGFVILMLLQQINNNDEDTAGVVFNGLL
ncbi:hypothetical protein Tco_1124878 [Tanacetum coccineum]|uniref:Uncharacterized protein n=1 Tax=Tanacetum coccineum TaxID=301880 RepID=A0ABQ5JAE5_9ASTR